MHLPVAEKVTGDVQSSPTIAAAGRGDGVPCRALDIALGVLIAAVPLTYSFLAANTLKWAILGFLTPVVALFWLWGGCGRAFRPLPKLVAPILALLLASQLSILQALNVYYAFQRFVILLVLFLVYLTVAYTSSRSEKRAKIVRYLLLTLLGSTALSLFGYATSCPASFVSPGEHLFRLFGNTNYGAAYLIIVVPLSLALFLTARRGVERILWGTTLFLAMMLLALSMVRGAWLSIGIGLAITLSVLGQGERSKDTLQAARRLSVLSGAILVGVAVLMAWPLSEACPVGGESFGRRVASILDLGTTSLQIRLALWEGTFRMIRDHLWTGVGIGNFVFASVPYRLAVIYQNPGVRLEHPHNEYLNLWAELGLLGLLALLWLFVRVVRLGWHLVNGPGVRRDLLAGILGGLAATAAYAHLFYVAHVPTSAMILAILLGMLDGMDRELGQHERAKPIRLAPLLAGLLVMSLLGFEYFLRPVVGEIYYWLAEKAFLAKRIEAGLNRLERSLEWDPRSYAARYRRAAILYAMGRYPETIREADMATKIHPKMDVAYGIMASAYLNLGEKAKAEEIFRQAVALNPNYPHALNNLGVLAADGGRVAEAEAMFLRAIEILGRTEMKPYANLGDLYAMTGRMKEALQMYETAVAIQPRSGANWYRVARLRVLTGDGSGAHAALARAIELDKTLGARAAKDPAFEALRQVH